MSETKNERLYLRTTKSKKDFLQALADDMFDGNLNALFDQLIDELQEEHEVGGE